MNKKITIIENKYIKNNDMYKNNSKWIENVKYSKRTQCKTVELY